jgi:hypothetical protein
LVLSVSTCTGVSAQPPTEIRLRFADAFASASKVFLSLTMRTADSTCTSRKHVGVHVSFYIERFIPKLVPSKDTLRVRHRDTPSFDTPVAPGLGEGGRQKILIHQVFNRSVDLGQV